MRAAIDDEVRHEREEQHAEELRPQRQRDGRDDEDRERQPCRDPTVEAGPPTRGEDNREQHPDERGAQDDEPGPVPEAASEPEPIGDEREIIEEERPLPPPIAEAFAASSEAEKKKRGRFRR